jgi:hemerythrin-like domain-containing protein
MPWITPIATDHQMILEGLEVLRLMADRLERHEFVDAEDIATVMGFLRDVGVDCLEHTENLLLRPALLRADQNEQILRLQKALARHQTIRPLFEDTAADVTFQDNFILHAHLFTKTVSDLIFEEDQNLLQGVVELLADPEGRSQVEKFAEEERRIRSIAAQRSSRLHWLETKYVYPHCI